MLTVEAETVAEVLAQFNFAPAIEREVLQRVEARAKVAPFGRYHAYHAACRIAGHYKYFGQWREIELDC